MQPTNDKQSNSLFEDLVNWPSAMWRGFDGMFSSDMPITPVETVETDGRLQYLVDLPGVQKDDLSVTQEGNMVRIEATRKGRTIRSNLSSSFTVAKRANPETLAASLEDGVLTLSFDLYKQVSTSINEPKKIEVKTSKSSKK
jgi:HSP20 family molecular chaperone IbpA